MKKKKKKLRDNECWNVSESVHTAVTKYHRQGGLDNKCFFLIVQEAGKSEIGGQQGRF